MKRQQSPLTFHSLRHTAVSLLKNAGVSDVIAMDIIGHKSEAVSRRYTHIESDTKRKALVRKAEDILEQDPPLIPVAYEQIYDAWYNKVRGQNTSTFFGIYDVVRWDTVWMAQA